MLTRNVPLHTGLKFEGEMHLNATIREESPNDQFTVLEGGFTGTLEHLKIMARRVVKLGPIDNPDEAIVRKLTRTDWELLVAAMEKLDEEQGIAAGLLKPMPGDDRGRAQPGGETPGSV